MPRSARHIRSIPPFFRYLFSFRKRRATALLHSNFAHHRILLPLSPSVVSVPTTAGSSHLSTPLLSSFSPPKDSLFGAGCLLCLCHYYPPPSAFSPATVFSFLDRRECGHHLFFFSFFQRRYWRRGSQIGGVGRREEGELHPHSTSCLGALFSLGVVAAAVVVLLPSPPVFLLLSPSLPFPSSLVVALVVMTVPPPPLPPRYRRHRKVEGIPFPTAVSRKFFFPFYPWSDCSHIFAVKRESMMLGSGRRKTFVPYFRTLSPLLLPPSPPPANARSPDGQWQRKEEKKKKTGTVQRSLLPSLLFLDLFSAA